MSVAMRAEPDMAFTRARRGFVADEEAAVHLQVAPRRAMIINAVEPGLLVPGLSVPMVREHPRRSAPMRALLDRLLLGREGRARRAIVDPDEQLAAELIRLSGLDPRWGFLQSARQVGDGTELDHWAIGPGGVYLLNAKHLPGSRLYVAGDRFLVDGLEQPFVPEIRGEARRSAGKISMSAQWEIGVTGVIVPFNDRKLVVEQFPDDVAVLDQIDVANWLVNRPEQLGKRQVMDAFSAARDATLWIPRFAV